MYHWLVLWDNLCDRTEADGLFRDHGNSVAGSTIDGVIYKDLRGIIQTLRSCFLIHKIWRKRENPCQEREDY